MWTIEYDNDTGAGDDGFWEWWEVTDGNRVFKCYDKESAVWLCGILNEYAPPGNP